MAHCFRGFSPLFTGFKLKRGWWRKAVYSFVARKREKEEKSLGQENHFPGHAPSDTSSQVPLLIAQAAVNSSMGESTALVIQSPYKAPPMKI